MANTLISSFAITLLMTTPNMEPKIKQDNMVMEAATDIVVEAAANSKPLTSSAVT
jgi:hypothetical protein